MSTEAAGRRCERLVRELQAEHRVPAVSAAVSRADRPLWTVAVGEASPGRAATADTAFRIGSITKTFTAVLVMQLRDQGLLDLDAPLSRHLDVPAHGELTLRHMLAHLSGLQREPHGDVWDTLRVPETARLVAELEQAERVLPPGRRWHYSNLAYSLLGEVVARAAGAGWAEVLHDRLLGPLGLDRTTLEPTEPAATGYLVEAYSDVAHPEPIVDMAGVAPAAQLWSTAADLASWGMFLADPDPAILAPSTIEEMCQLTTVVDNDDWRVGWGLGLILVHRGDRTVHCGHDGAMQGFLAGMYTRRDAKVAAVVLGSSGTASAICDLPHALLAATLEEDPADVQPWRPGSAPPEGLRSVLGVWWSEGMEYVFSWHSERLEARARAAPAAKPPSVFAMESADLLRVVSGREAGEKLRLTRDERGTVVVMHWATYRCTRAQEGAAASRG
ncbi:MAG: beta-lactamase family protein [Actinomycetota bacterium]|nr:beta-lactamase family protein [Actinomycetota bacterium]